MKWICKENIKKEKWWISAICFVLFLSFTLRIYQLGNVPFVADEFLDVNATYGYFKTKTWHAWDFNHNQLSVRENNASDHRAWLYRIQIAWLYRYLAPTEEYIRLVSVMWGVIMTGLLYIVTYNVTKNRWIAIGTMFLWAVGVPIIEINRKVRMYSMFAPMFLLFWWSIYLFLHNKKMQNMKQKSFLQKMMYGIDMKYSIPVIFFGGMSYHLHPLTGAIVFVLFVYYSASLIFFRERRLQSIVVLSSMIIGILVISIIQKNIFGGIVFFENHWNYVVHVLCSYWHPLLAIGFFCGGIYYLCIQKNNRSGGMWIVSTFLSILLSAIFLWNRNVGAQYIFFIQAFGFMIVASGVYACAYFLKNNMHNKYIFVIFMMSSSVLLPSYNYFFLSNNTYHITSKSQTPNYRKVFLYIKKNIRKDDVIVTRNFRNYYWSGLNVHVYDFGSERTKEQLQKEGKYAKITMADLEHIMQKHAHGWIVFSDNDEKFITKEVRTYCEKQLHKKNDSLLLRGNVFVYKWGDDK